MGVTKTDFMRGMQCPRMLWLDAHRPQEKIIPPEVQQRLDEGNEFGDRAMGMFGPYEETTAYREDGRLDYAAMIRRTQECLEAGTQVICEAAFSRYGDYCAVDLLRRAEDGYEIYEVKDSDGVKEQFKKDVAFQRYLVRGCGVNVVRCYVVTRGAEGKEYAIEDVTAYAVAYWRTVYENIRRLGAVKRQKDEVFAPTGEQCETPYRCWYWEYCHREEEKNGASV